MSDLRTALLRLQQREPTAAAAATPAHLRPSSWDTLELPPPRSPIDCGTAAAAIRRLLPQPDLTTVVGLGLRGELPPLWQPVVDALTAASPHEAMQFGPGALDDAERLAAQRTALQRRGSYGFILASAERALLRPAALRQTAGAIVVIEFAHTTQHDLQLVRNVLAEQRVPLLGVSAVRDE